MVCLPICFACLCEESKGKTHSKILQYGYNPETISPGSLYRMGSTDAVKAMSRHLERLLQIDTLLRSGQRQTADSLGAFTEVSERTIRSDIAFLRDRYHAPISFNRIKGYYYTDPTWRLPTIILSQGELFALTLGARMLEAYAGSAYALNLRSAIARLGERLPEQTWVDLQQLAEDRILFRGGAEIDLDPVVWHRLEDACQTRKTVQMTYYTASRDAVSERALDPYVLHIYRGTNPYVIGYRHKRQEIRWFGCDLSLIH